MAMCSISQPVALRALGWSFEACAEISLGRLVKLTGYGEDGGRITMREMSIETPTDKQTDVKTSPDCLDTLSACYRRRTLYMEISDMEISKTVSLLRAVIDLQDIDSVTVAHTRSRSYPR